MKKSSISDSEKFMALSESERAKVMARLDVESPESRLARSVPLGAGDKERWKKFKARTARPPIGQSTRAISE